MGTGIDINGPTESLWNNGNIQKLNCDIAQLRKLAIIIELYV